jgi:hypothetical protein
MFHLGVPMGEVPRAKLCAELLSNERSCAAIHATAAMSYKTWSPAGFLAVADYLAQELGLEPVFIGAADDDLTVFSRYRVVARRLSVRGKRQRPRAHRLRAGGSRRRALRAKTLASPSGISGIKIDAVLAAIEELRQSEGLAAVPDAAVRRCPLPSSTT